MNVYDFDGTLYNGDSTIDFYKYCLSQKKSILRHFPIQFKGWFGFHIGLYDHTRMKEHYYRFFKDITIEETVENFWDQNIQKIADWYSEKHQDDDVVISASPDFLIRSACKRIGIKNVIASPIDPITGKPTGKNCRDEEKVRRFRELYGDSPIDEFYSDSDADMPLAKLSQRAFKVIWPNIIEWEIERSEERVSNP